MCRVLLLKINVFFKFLTETYIGSINWFKLHKGAYIWNTTVEYSNN